MATSLGIPTCQTYGLAVTTYDYKSLFIGCLIRLNDLNTSTYFDCLSRVMRRLVV